MFYTPSIFYDPLFIRPFTGLPENEFIDNIKTEIEETIQRRKSTSECIDKQLVFRNIKIAGLIFLFLGLIVTFIIFNL